MMRRTLGALVGAILAMATLLVASPAVAELDDQQEASSPFVLELQPGEEGRYTDDCTPRYEKGAFAAQICGEVTWVKSNGHIRIPLVELDVRGDCGPTEPVFDHPVQAHVDWYRVVEKSRSGGVTQILHNEEDFSLDYCENQDRRGYRMQGPCFGVSFQMDLKLNDRQDIDNVRLSANGCE